uniref:AAA domain-containing protein n=1 Tax=Acinetobacter junii TaxID=40215 RepID=UPI0012500EFD
RFYEQFINDQNQDWYIEDTQLSNKQKLSFISSSDGNLIFASKVNLKVNLNVGGEYLLYPSNLNASEKQLIRRNYAFNKLVDQQHLLDSLIDPTECLQEMDYNYNIENSLNSLDVSKQKIFQQLLKVHPNYVVQGPPGVGKTYLISTLVKQIFEDERDSKIILSAQSHSTVQVLYDEIKKKVETDDLIIIDAFNNEENSED